MRRYLHIVYAYWLAFGHSIGRVVTPVQLLLVYVLVFGPSRMATMLFGRDLLDRRFRSRPSFWSQREPGEVTLDSARHQF